MACTVYNDSFFTNCFPAGILITRSGTSAIALRSCVVFVCSSLATVTR